MKALTVYQPWASLIIEGAKPYEFRSWPVPKKMIGERIVIHAAARAIDRNEIGTLIAALEKGGDAAARTCLAPDLALPILHRGLSGELPMAAGLGTVLLKEARLGCIIADEFGIDRANDSDRDLHANFGWPMLDIQPFSQPIGQRGMQGLWTWQEPGDLLI